MNRRSRWLGLIAASLGPFLGALDIAVNVALPNITSSLATEFETIQWIIICYVGTTTALQLSLGSAADRYGLKRIYLIGIALYGAAVFGIGLAETLPTILALRILQAIGIGCCIVAAPALVTQLFSVQTRGRALGAMTAIGTLGMITGSLGGGLLVDHFGWHAIFSARVPICVLVFGLAAFALPASAPSPVGRFDFAGAGILFVAVASLILALTFGGRQGWSAPHVLMLGGLALSGAVTFVVVQRRSLHPVLNLRLLLLPALRRAVTASFFLRMATFVNLFLLPFFAAGVVGVDAPTLGLLLTLTPLASSAAAPVGGWLADRLPPARVSAAGIAIAAIALASFSLLTVDASVSDIAIRMVAGGIGLGLFQPANSSIIMGSVPAEQRGSGGAIIALAGGLGTVISVAVLSALHESRVGLHEAALGAAGTAAADVGIEAFVAAFSDIYLIAAGLAVAALATQIGRRSEANPPRDPLR